MTEGEGSAQEVVVKKLKKIRGLELDRWEPSQKEIERYPLHPVRGPSWSYKGRPNAVGVLPGSGGGRSLILNGHIDVVSPEPVTGWKEDPWGGQIKDGRLYGRGSMDMKGGLAAMLFAVWAVAAEGVPLAGDVIFESVVEEEYGGGGTIAALVRGYKADAAIIPEATSSDGLCIASGGSRFFRIRVEGKPQWPHLAHLGVNSIGLSSKVYRGLVGLERQRYRRLKGKYPLLEGVKSGGGEGGRGRPANMTVGILKAGDWPATVAGWAEMEGRVGLAPGESGQDVEKEIEGAVQEVATGDPWMREHRPSVEWWGARREGYQLSEDSPLVTTMKRNVEAIVGRCTLFGTSSASDAAYLVPKIGGYGGIPTVWYGPGGAGAHTFDEYVVLDEMIDVTKVLAATILDWCGAPDDAGGAGQAGSETARRTTRPGRVPPASSARGNKVR